MQQQYSSYPRVATPNAGTVPRPTALSVMLNNIPAMLTEYDAWVCWRYIQKGAKWTKVPFQPGGQRASATDHATWSNFDAVAAAYQRGGFDGIGFVLDGSEVCNGLVVAGVDLDHVTADATRWDRAQQIVTEFGSYAEWSPSRKGLRIFCLARPLAKGVSQDGVELYTAGRYLTVTGHVLGGYA